jgi:sugar lactone lactonase YvrE
LKFLSRNVFLILIILTLFIMVGHMPHASGQLLAGDILVLDFEAGTGGKAALFRVDPTTGARTILSDFGLGANQGVDLGEGMALEASGQILVTDPSAGTGGNGALFRVDPTTGARTLLSDFGSGVNQGVGPHGVAVEATGQILVIDYDAGTAGRGALFRVDPTTGVRTLLSDFGSGVNQGVDPCDVAVEASGQILVIDPSAGAGAQGALFRVDPTTGARTLLSNFGSGANRGEDPVGLVVEASGQILVADSSAGSIQGALFRVDPTTGARTVLSDFDSGANQGVEGPHGVAVEASGQILATDYDAGTNGQGALFRIDPITGVRTILSDFGSGANQGIDPWAVVVVPPPANASGIYQGDLILQGNNVTTIEGRFDINGSIIIEENATLILKNALINFTDSGFGIHMQDAANGNPRLQAENTQITGNSDNRFYDNSSATFSNLTGNVYFYFDEDSSGSFVDSAFSGFQARASSSVTVSNSTVEYLTVTMYNGNASIVNLSPGFFDHWDFQENCSVAFKPQTEAPEVVLNQTTVNDWSFSFQGNSTATITRSELIHLHTNMDTTMYPTARVEAYDSNINTVELYSSAIVTLTNTTCAQLKPYQSTAVYVYWYLDVQVLDDSPNPRQNVQPANVTAAFSNGTLAEERLTASDGHTRLTLMEKMTNATGNYPVGSYTVNATYLFYYSGSTVNMTGNQTIILILEDLVIPEFPSFLTVLYFAMATLAAAITYRHRPGRMRSKRINVRVFLLSHVHRTVG